MKVNRREFMRKVGAGSIALASMPALLDIQRIRPSPALIRGAVLRVVCDLGPAGLATGEIEGYTLSIPGTEFSAGGTPGPFRQLSPNVGLTVFRTPEILT